MTSRRSHRRRRDGFGGWSMAEAMWFLRLRRGSGPKRNRADDLEPKKIYSQIQLKPFHRTKDNVHDRADPIPADFRFHRDRNTGPPIEAGAVAAGRQRL